MPYVNETYDGKAIIAHPFLFLKIIIHFVMQNNPIESHHGKMLGHTKIYKVSDQQPLLYKKCIGAKNILYLTHCTTNYYQQ